MTPVPTLDEIASNPAVGAALDPQRRALLISRCAAALAALSAPLVVPPAAAVDRVLSVKETAAVLGLRPSYVYELARRGDVPSMRHGKHIRFRESDVRRYADSHYRAGRGRNADPAADLHLEAVS